MTLLIVFYRKFAYSLHIYKINNKFNFKANFSEHVFFHHTHTGSSYTEFKACMFALMSLNIYQKRCDGMAGVN